MPFLLRLRRLWLPASLLILLLLIFALSVTALSLPDWVSLGHDDFLIEGGLVRCNNCPGDFEKRWYRDIANSNYCSPQNTSMAGLCDLIQDLYTAGVLFLVSELCAVLALVGWATLVAVRLFGGKPTRRLLYAVAGSATFLHALGLLLWMGVTEATYDDCRDLLLNGSRPNICITVGPTLVLLCMCLYAASVVLLIMLQRRREDELKPIEVPSATMRFTFGNITEMSESKIQC